jgi:hypothetical protein
MQWQHLLRALHIPSGDVKTKSPSASVPLVEDGLLKACSFQIRMNAWPVRLAGHRPPRPNKT